MVEGGKGLPLYQRSLLAAAKPAGFPPHDLAVVLFIVIFAAVSPKRPKRGVGEQKRNDFDPIRFGSIPTWPEMQPKF
jgi:hypothetical protein